MDWLSASDRAVSCLVQYSKGSAATAGHSRSSRRDLWPDDLAGALGVFFCFGFCGCASGFARADQSRPAVWIAFVMSIFPILRDWDMRLWPNEAEYVRRIEQRNESVRLRDLAVSL